MRIAAELLPPPSHVDVLKGTSVLRSAESPLRFSTDLDPQLRPRRFRFTWSNPPAGQVDAIRAHYEDHCTATFQLTVPQFGTLWLQWSVPPVSPMASNAAASSVSGELEEVLAH